MWCSVCMKITDARNHPKEVQQHNRNQAIRLLKNGKSRKEIAEIVQVYYDVVCRWIRAWKKGGDKASKLKKRGRGSAEQRIVKKRDQVGF